jgi:hypothetical protein
MLQAGRLSGFVRLLQAFIHHRKTSARVAPPVSMDEPAE